MPDHHLPANFKRGHPFSDIREEVGQTLISLAASRNHVTARTSDGRRLIFRMADDQKQSMIV